MSAVYCLLLFIFFVSSPWSLDIRETSVRHEHDCLSWVFLQKRLGGRGHFASFDLLVIYAFLGNLPKFLKEKGLLR